MQKNFRSIRYRLDLCCLYCAVFIGIVLIANQVNMGPVFKTKVKKFTFRGRRKMAVAGPIDTSPYTYDDMETSVFPTSENETIVDISYQIPDLTDYESNVQIDGGSTQKQRRPVILLWNPLQLPSNPIPKIPLCGGGCDMTALRDRFNESDAVIFTMKEMNLSDLPNPRWRRSDQAFVWWSEESAWTSKIMYEKKLQDIEKNYINWTMTYKKDSDVNAMMIPYTARKFVQARLKEHYGIQASRLDREDNTEVPTTPRTEQEIFTLKRQATKLVRKKSKMAVWVASNCGYTAGAVLRRNIVTRLQFLGLKVDIFGECGDKNIPITLAKFAELISEYRFYLSFENTLHCNEYITEKFWYNSLYSGAVPIVWGPRKSDVLAVAPEGSFIHYEDFDTDEHLVDYLIRLDADDDEYATYFAWWWKTPEYFPIYDVTEMFDDGFIRYAMYDFEMNAFCHLCSLLNRQVHVKTSKSIPSLEEWWYRRETKTCLSRTQGAKFKTYGSDSGNPAYQIVSA